MTPQGGKWRPSHHRRPLGQSQAKLSSRTPRIQGWPWPQIWSLAIEGQPSHIGCWPLPEQAGRLTTGPAHLALGPGGPRKASRGCRGQRERHGHRIQPPSARGRAWPLDPTTTARVATLAVATAVVDATRIRAQRPRSSRSPWRKRRLRSERRGSRPTGPEADDPTRIWVSTAQATPAV